MCRPREKHATTGISKEQKGALKYKGPFEMSFKRIRFQYLFSTVLVSSIAFMIWGTLRELWDCRALVITGD